MIYLQIAYFLGLIYTILDAFFISKLHKTKQSFLTVILIIVVIIFWPFAITIFLMDHFTKKNKNKL